LWNRDCGICTRLDGTKSRGWCRNVDLCRWSDVGSKKALAALYLLLAQFSVLFGCHHLVLYANNRALRDHEVLSRTDFSVEEVGIV
jgi:hypothetical protein